VPMKRDEDAAGSPAQSRVQQLQEQNTELQAIVKAYEEKFNQIKEPPLLSAYVLRLNGDDLEPHEVVVSHGAQVLKVACGQVEKSSLRQGQFVWLHPKTYAIITATRQFEQGVLLYGPPGCGKTLIGKAVATENSFTFFNVKVADILSKWVGESENMIKALFRKARENAPSIIFFDEFDALGTTRGQQDSAGVQ